MFVLFLIKSDLTCDYFCLQSLKYKHWAGLEKRNLMWWGSFPGKHLSIFQMELFLTCCFIKAEYFLTKKFALNDKNTGL